MKIETIKKNLEEARRKGWWMACFYWELKLEKFNKDSLNSNIKK